MPGRVYDPDHDAFREFLAGSNEITQELIGRDLGL